MARVELPVVPIVTWPRARTPENMRDMGGRMLKTTPGAALSRLREELFRMRAKDCRLAIAVRERDITRFGELRANATVQDPGVIVYFTHPTRGDLTFANDNYCRWWHNVNGIAMTIEALRGIDRWGAVQNAEQFAGFGKLPGFTSLTMGSTAAVAILSRESGLDVPYPMTPDWIREAGRKSRAATHPDVCRERKRWDDVEAALRAVGGGI